MADRIAIVGAGISGLACATYLKNVGLDVTVFEKSRGPSGRISTRVSNDWQCDHGAQYFTARDVDFYQEVQRWQQAGVAAIWEPRLHETHGSTNFIKTSTTSSTTAKSSLTQRYVGVPTNTAPAKFLASFLNVITEHTVTQLEKTTLGWQVSTKEHGAFNASFDAVIFAIPSPQALVLVESVSELLADIAGSVKMRGCWALMCRYTHSLDLPFDGLFINQQLLSWAARDSAKPGRDNPAYGTGETWVLHASSEWSELHLEDDSDQVALEMINAFIQVGGKSPSDYTIHRWRYAECVDYLDVVYGWDQDKQLGLCGDWLNNGKVEGAWLSGQQLAKHISSTNLNRKAGLL